MEYTHAHERSLNLLSVAPVAYLTTIDQNGWPNTRAMLNLRNEEKYPNLIPVFASHSQDLQIYFTTNTSSGKVAQIDQNNKASVYFCNPEEWRGLMIGGPLSIISDQEIRHALWQNEWDMYYPEGVQDPDYAILSLKPRIAKYYEYLDSSVWNMEE